MILKLVHMIKQQRTIPHSFYKASITLIPKVDKDTAIEEHHGPVSPLNMNAKTLSKILAIGIQLQSKKTIHHDHVDFLVETQGGFDVCKSVRCDINRVMDTSSRVT